MIKEALRYAASGVHVFPCRGKIPLTPHGVHDASTDEEQLRQRWLRYPNANIAIATGASNFVVIDVDKKNGVDGYRSFDQCLARYGDLPSTRMASTPNAGMHLYFRHPEGVTIRPSASMLGEGVDVRAGSSYVIAPPSSIDGKHYRWSVTKPSAELPEAWIEALQPPKREPVPPPTFAAEPDDTRVRSYCLAALQSEARELAALRAGRNHKLWQSAAALGGLVYMGAIDSEDVRRALLWACSTWPDCNPRKDRDTLERGLQFGLEHPRGNCEADERI